MTTWARWLYGTLARRYPFWFPWYYRVNRERPPVKNPATLLLGAMWFVGGGVSLAMIDAETAGAWITILNTALITLGGTAIVLSQRYHAARRAVEAAGIAAGLADARDRSDLAAADLAAGLATTQRQTQSDSADFRELLDELRARINDLRERLDAVINQRDRLWHQNDALLARVLLLTGLDPAPGDPPPADPTPKVPTP